MLMGLSAKEKDEELQPIRLSVELSPALYEAILQILESSKTSMSVAELLEALEDHLGGALAETVSEVTGVAAPFPQGIEVQIISENEDEEPDLVEGFRQAWREAMEGNTRPIADLWKTLDADEKTD